MKYSQEVIDQVTAANDIVDIISDYTDLKRRGSSYMGCCPFHSEKTPSFSVSREKQLFHCFGCGESGSLIGFVMKAENIGFVDALKFLADRAGIKLPEPQAETPEEKERERKKNVIYEMNRTAANYYYKNLQRNQEALQYLKNRGLEEKTIRELGIGLSPSDWSVLSRNFRKRGMSEEDLIEGGLSLRAKRGNLYDRFRNRIMFPIQNSRNKLIGFGGRAWTKEDQGPKYLNSPESPVFHKGYELYNLNRARKTVSALGFIILCEGYMDVASLYQHGFTNAVAALGTAFTLEHAKLLERITNDILLCFDGDAAGEKATVKALEILEKTSLKIRILRLPPQHDPDSFIKENGTQAFREEIEKAMTPLEFRMRSVRSAHRLESYASKVDYLNDAVKVLRTAPAEERNFFIKEIADETSFDEISIKEKIENYKPAEDKEVIQEARTPVSGKSRAPVPKAYRQLEATVMRVWMEEPGRLSRSGLRECDFEEGYYRWLYRKISQAEKNQPVSLNALFVSTEDMIYNKKTSDMMEYSFNRALSLYDQAVPQVRQYANRQRVEELKAAQNATMDKGEKEKIALEISDLLRSIHECS